MDLLALYLLKNFNPIWLSCKFNREKHEHVLAIKSYFFPLSAMSYCPATISSRCSATFTSVTEAGGQLPAL